MLVSRGFSGEQLHRRVVDAQPRVETGPGLVAHVHQVVAHGLHAALVGEEAVARDDDLDGQFEDVVAGRDSVGGRSRPQDRVWERFKGTP